jgi:3-isopropylmalate/(R)-2-methylmalate dehydratase large subunit
VEAGGTSGVCLPDRVTVDYLWPFIGPDGDRSYATKEAALRDFEQWRSDDDAVYDGVIDLDCSTLEPLATVGYKPDHVKTIRELAGTKVDQVYIGSCTNGRIEDLREAAAIVRGKKIAQSVRGILSPATTAVYTRALREGLISTFLDAGFCVTNPTCGACLGMSNGVLAEGEVCASTTNRNFYGRMGKGGMVHLMSPASAAAAAIAGYITSQE